MTLRRSLGLAAAAVGGVTLTNRALAARAGPLSPPLDGEGRTFRWRGMDVSYVEAGDPDAPTLLLLHGITAAATSGEFRRVFAPLAETYHVVAPDLPGFGCSDRPPLRYSAALYEDFVADFVREFDRPGVVASSLTAAYVARAVASGAETAGLVLVCPTARAGPSANEALRELLRAPLAGTFLFNLLGSKAPIRHFNADHGYYDPDVAAEWVEYEWRTAHQPGARFAPASFVSGFLDSEVDLGSALRGSGVPVTLVWGREADIVPLKEGRTLADEADARLVVFDDAKLVPHAEYPTRFVEAVREAIPVEAAV